MKYKIGDWIVYIDKERSKWWKDLKGISLYGKIGKIIDIYKSDRFIPYLIEFKEYINGHDGIGKGKNGHCSWCSKQEITSLDRLKLKKLLEG